MKYIEDANGNPVQVVLEIDDYRRLLDRLEELESIAAFDAAMAADEPVMSLQEAMEQSGIPRLEQEDAPPSR